jgi:diguanylate cyclase (GGDEF)-like protein/PAS domain S-box-containing protein
LERSTAFGVKNGVEMIKQKAAEGICMPHNNIMPEDVHILLVNSDPYACAVLRKTLGFSGYTRITEAESGIAAIQVLRTEPVDLVITEIDIARLDGWRLARLVRSDVFLCEASIPIIVVAAMWCERIAEVTAREFGINKVLAFENHKQVPEIIQTSLSTSSVVCSNPSLLVIEDNPDTGQLAKRVLKQRFEVEIATDGEAGLEAWGKRRHDLVLLDVMLPKMSGNEVLREILTIRKNQPVVIMTAYSTMELAEELMLAGAADFIIKPFRTEQLRRVCEVAAKREDYLESVTQFAERTQSLRDSKEAFRKVSETHQRLLDNLSTIVLELNEKGQIRFLNQAWESLTGLPVEESVGRELKDFISTESLNLRGIYQKRLNALLAGEISDCKFELPLIDKEGRCLWAELKLNAMCLQNEVKAVFGCLNDVTQRKLAQQEVEHMAMHDSLTGLHNRHYFEIIMRQLAASSVSGKEKHSLLYIDLDHFKVVNDSFGHHQGDMVLKEISELLSVRLRHSDILCRLGGDEYAVLLTHTNQRQAVVIANNIREIIAGFQRQVKDQLFGVSCSIGISEINGEAARPEDYLKQADIALYVAKERGRNLIHVYDPEDRESEELKQSVNWIWHFRKAIADDLLMLYFQPILHIASGRITHYEALIRLYQPDQGVVLPHVFIPALEKAGEMAMLDHWVIRRSICLLKENPSLRRLAINLSVQAFADERLVPLVEERLREEEVEPSRVIFELTESASLANIEAMKRMIFRLIELGCSFAIDDFGTGFSTFNYLKQVPADTIKVDGSFIQNLEKDPVNQALVRSIHEIARVLGKKTVAEFVENEASFNLVKNLGIDYAQGYYIGRPVPLSELKL